MREASNTASDQGCDVAPITDWGVTEPPNTEALLATVRQTAEQGERAMLELSWTMANVNWRAALDAIASELEQGAIYKDALEACSENLQETVAELERVRAQRIDTLRRLHYAEACLDRAVEALREILEWAEGPAAGDPAEMARAALAEIEESGG